MVSLAEIRICAGLFFSCVARLWSAVTLEPLIFMFRMSYGVGTGVNEKKHILKVCHVQMHHNLSACFFLTGHTQDQVQVEATRLDLLFDVAEHLPTILLPLFAGALSDRYGRKPLLYLPIFGSCLASVLSLLHLKFFGQFPVEFMLLENFYSYLGGASLYYLGIFGYGADITQEKNRAYRLALFDGVEMVGQVIGRFVAPRLLAWGGYVATTSLSAFLNVASLAYLGLMVTESKTNKLEENESAKHQERFLEEYLWLPFREFASTLSKKRDGHRRLLLHLLLFSYACYWFILPYKQLMYFFYTKTAPGFTLLEYGNLGTVEELVGAFTLFVLMPYLTRRWHETSVALLINASVLSGLALLACAGNPRPYYYLAAALGRVDIGQYSLARSLGSKLVGEEEVGKIFAALAVTTGLNQMLSGSAFKSLYAATVSNPWPGAAAFLLLAAAVYAAAAAANAALWVAAKVDVEEKDNGGGKDQDLSTTTATIV